MKGAAQGEHVFNYLKHYLTHRYFRFTISLIWLWFLCSLIVPNPVTLYPCTIPSSPDNSILKGILRVCIKKCDIEMLCLSLVSARTVASWMGLQYIITDQEEEIRSRCNIGGLEFIAMPETKFQWDDHDNRRSNSRFRLQVKENMWNLVKYTPLHTNAYLLYADSDLVFMNCLEPEKLLPNAKDQLGLFPDNWCYDCNEYNMGVSLSNFEAGECFRDISEEIGNGDTPREQVALDTLLKGEGHSCKNIYKMDKDYIVYVSNDLITPRLQLLKTYLSRKGSPMFAHYGHATRTRFYWKRIFSNLQSQLVSLNREKNWGHPSVRLELEETFNLQSIQIIILSVSGFLLLYMNSKCLPFSLISKVKPRKKKTEVSKK